MNPVARGSNKSDDGLATALSNVERAVRAVTTNAKMLASADDIEAFALRAALADVAVRLKNVVDEALGTVALLATDAASTADVALDTYAERLRQALLLRNLDVQGHAPLLIVNGIVFVTFDPQTAQLTVNDEAIHDLRVPSAVTAVLKKLEALKAGSAPVLDFVSQFAVAYDQEVANQGRQPGDQVRLDAVHRELMWMRQSKTFRATMRASAYREYTAEMLRVDLFNALVKQATAPGDRDIVVDSGADTQGALWMFVPSLGRPGYVGRVRLVSKHE